MKFESPLSPGRLVRRYKRFLADVILDSGEQITAHTANTGSMLGCAEPGSAVWLSRSDNPKRKYAYSWEMVEAGSTLVGINTALANRLVAEAIEGGVIAELQGYEQCRSEVRYGVENSRVDLYLEDAERGACFVEVKNVTASIDEGIAIFPDAVSARGTKHLRELATMAKQGHRGVLCFCVQRGDVHEVRPADVIDPLYGETLREVLERGVEVIAYRADVSPEGIALTTRLPVVCP